ncbi:hypothetical protein [Mesorhizobium escarrei]|nr:hypothetical protein [Mesorhizobium escarrei]
MAIANASANALFQRAILENRNDFAVRSIPVAANESRPAVVIHLLPLRRAAHDIFTGADILVAATEVRASAVRAFTNPPRGPVRPDALRDTFGGRAFSRTTLERCGIRLEDHGKNRPDLSRTDFRQDRTRQQSQLVALLKSTQPLNRR